MRIPPPQRSQSSTRTEAGEQLFAGFVRWAIRIPKESLSGLPPVTGERQPGALPSAIGPTRVVRVVLAERSEFRAAFEVLLPSRLGDRPTRHRVQEGITP